MSGALLSNSQNAAGIWAGLFVVVGIVVWVLTVIPQHLPEP